MKRLLVTAALLASLAVPVAHATMRPPVIVGPPVTPEAGAPVSSPAVPTGTAEPPVVVQPAASSGSASTSSDPNGHVGATQPPIVVGAIATADDSSASGGVLAVTHPVAAKVTLGSYPLVCGRPRQAVAVTLPAAVTVPRVIAAGMVRLNGAVPARVTVSGRTVAIRPAVPEGIQCQSIVLGRLAIAFGSSAGLATTSATRTYRVVVRTGARAHRATLTLSG